MHKNMTKTELQSKLEQAQKRVAELEIAYGNNEGDNRFSAIFRASPSQMLLTDPNTGNIIEVNDAFLNTLGFSREETIGNNVINMNLFADPGQRAKLLQLIQTQGYLGVRMSSCVPSRVTYGMGYFQQNIFRRIMKKFCLRS